MPEASGTAPGQDLLHDLNNAAKVGDTRKTSSSTLPGRARHQPSWDVKPQGQTRVRDYEGRWRIPVPGTDNLLLYSASKK